MPTCGTGDGKGDASENCALDRAGHCYCPAPCRPKAAIIAATTGVAMPKTEMKSPGRDAIEAYLSDDGYICLKQTDELGDDAIVMLLPHDIPQVIEWLQCLARQFPAPPKQA